MYPKVEIRGHAFVECYIEDFDGCDSRLEVVPNMLVQSVPLKQAFWVQLLILESPIKIFRNWNKCMPPYFGGICE